MFVGIDVAKAELVVSILPSAERFTVVNDERGVRTLVERLRALAPTLIVLEATGGYELLGVAALAAAALPVVVVNPRQVRHLPLERQSRQKARDFRLAQLRRMTSSIGDDESADPVNVRGFGARTVPPLAQPAPHGLHQAKSTVGLGRPGEVPLRDGWKWGHSAQSRDPASSLRRPP